MPLDGLEDDFFAGPAGQSILNVSKRGELFGRAGQAMLNAITDHVDEKAAAEKAAADGGAST